MTSTLGISSFKGGRRLGLHTQDRGRRAKRVFVKWEIQPWFGKFFSAAYLLKSPKWLMITLRFVWQRHVSDGLTYALSNRAR